MSYFCIPVQRVLAIQAEAFLRNSQKPVIVKYFADWCDHCQDIEDLYQRASCKYSSKAEFIAVAHGEDDRTEAFFEQYQIEIYPTVAAYKNGKLLEKLEGVYDEDTYMEFFEKYTGA